jgi:hypothetical protein
MIEKKDYLRIKVFARASMGIAKDSEFVDWAISELSNNNNSESIKILAGLQNPLDHSEVQRHVANSVKELNVKSDNIKIIDQYAELLAILRLDNKISSKEIVDEMYNIYNFTGHNIKYVGWFDLKEYFDDFYKISYKDIEDVINSECKKILPANENH